MLRARADEYLKDWTEPTKLYNCAEVTLRAMNDVYELGLSEQTLKTAAGFGGGMFTGDACGVVTGAAMGLAHLFANTSVPYKNRKLGEALKLWGAGFSELHGHTRCDLIKPMGGCQRLVSEAMDILEVVVAEVQQA